MKKLLLSTAMLAGLSGFAGLANAQTTNLSDADKSFLMKDSRGAAYELETAKLAESRAERQDVKSYAQKLVQDHETYNAALEKLGKDEGLTLPTEPDQTDRDRLAELEKQKGKAFDTMFISDAVKVNAQDKKDAEAEKAETKNPAIKAFIAKFAATDAEHEEMAKKLENAKE